MFISNRQKDFLFWLSGVVLCTSALAALGSVVEREWTDRDRSPASIPPLGRVEPMTSAEKMAKLRPLNQHMPRQFAKGHAVVEIEMTGSFKGALTNGSSGEIKAILKAQTDLDGYQYAWLLPEGIKAVSASTSGSLDPLVRGESTTLSLDVLSETDSNQQIHLHVYKLAPNGEAIGQMAQFNTVHQDEINQSVQVKAQALENSFEERPVKMMQ